MRALLLITLLLGLLANQSSEEKCFCHGKIYTKVNGVVVDSFLVMERLGELKKIENSGHRVREKEDLILIMKHRPCK